MDTESVKKTSASSPLTEELQALDVDLDPFVSQVGATNPQDIYSDWMVMTEEFDRRVSSCIDALSNANQAQLHHHQIFFEKSSKSIIRYFQDAEFTLNSVEKRAGSRFTKFAVEIAHSFDRYIRQALEDGRQRYVCFTAVEYQSYKTIKNSLQSIVARNEERLVSRDIETESGRNRTLRTRQNSTCSERSIESRNNTRTFGERTRSWNRSFESEELRREIQWYDELPPPWNQRPTQCPRKDRLDISRLVQVAGERKFKGELEDYPRWRNSFINLIADVRCLTRHKVNALMSALEPVMDRISDFVPFNFDGYKEIISNLEKEFGGSFRQMKRFDEYFDSNQKISFNNLEEFRIYLRKLTGYRAILVDSGEAVIFSLPHAFRRMIAPLPGAHIRELQAWMHTSKKSPNPQTLIEWATDRLDRLITETEVDPKKKKNFALKSCYAKELKIQEQINSEEDELPLYNDPEVEAFAKMIIARAPDVCMFGCDKKHQLSDCPRFKETNVPNRKTILRGWKYLVCYSCLQSGHTSKSCKQNQSCEECGLTTHHTMLHETDKEINTLIYSCSFLSSKTFQVLLPYIEVKAFNDKKAKKVLAMIDSGANVSIISRRLSNQLNLCRVPVRINLDTAGGIVVKQAYRVKLTIQSLEGKDNWIIEAYEVDDESIVESLPRVKLEEIRGHFEHLKQVPKFENDDLEVDLLFGSDLAYLTSSEQVISGKTFFEPIAEKSKLGWSIRGPVDSNCFNQKQYVYKLQRDHLEYKENTMEEIKELIERSWILHDPTGGPSSVTVDQTSTQILEQTMKIQDGFVQSGILWKSGKKPRVPMNRDLALRRLLSLRKLLSRDQKIKELYESNIQTWIDQGVLVNADQASSGEINYLCHFPVIRMDKSTTRVRTVVDAAARFQGTAINDYISAGPNLANDIRRVLIRFRRHRVGIGADIKSMFTQIRLLPEERSYNRLLWFDSSGNVRDLQFNRFSFGLACSPSVAIAASRYLVRNSKDVPEFAKDAVLNSTVVDDTVDSVESEEKAEKLITGIKEIYSQGGMKVHKLVSNSSKFLSLRSEDEIHPEITSLWKNPTIDSRLRILGIRWDPRNDNLIYELEFQRSEVLTKRHMATVIARIFDPIGLISPLLVDLRSLLQKTWTTGISWDEEITSKERLAWNSKVEEVSGKIHFDRCLQKEATSKKQLHIFCDASEKALGATAYLVVSNEDENTIDSNLVATRGRIAPLRYSTIPRLELQAAVEGAELANSLSQVLDLLPEEIFLWTDSLDVLYWIASASRSLKVFVANRVSFIQSRTWIDHWAWVPTNENPADILSRGSSLKELSISQLWYKGPQFLMKTAPYPDIKARRLSVIGQKEVRAKIKRLRINEEREGFWLAKLKKFSSWKRFLKGYIRLVQGVRRLSHIDLEEKEKLKIRIIALLQKERFPEYFEKNSQKTDLQLQCFKPFVRSDTKTLHATGRISQAEHLSWNMRFPLIIPERSHWSTIIVRDVHKYDLKHNGGARGLVAAVNEEYFILKLQQLSKSIIRKCIVCRKTNFRTINPSFGPLPTFRLPSQHRTSVFNTTGIDCFGPFELGKKKQFVLKTYVLLFTCTLYRAVHLEYLEDLSTEKVLLAFERFIACRGRPSRIISDNGRNFIGTNNILRKTFKNLEHEFQVQYPLIKWDFNSPGTPHKGGVFERMIGLVRTALAKSLRGIKVNRELFETVLKQTEGALNNRPLQTPSTDLEDEVLTPNHFLRGEKFLPLFPTDKTEDLYKRWKILKIILDRFWRRYITQVISELKYSAKRRFKDEEITPGTLVLLKEDSKKDINFPIYPTGKIEEVFKGADGIPRTLRLRIGGKSYIRGVTAVAPLFV